MYIITAGSDGIGRTQLATLRHEHFAPPCVFDMLNSKIKTISRPAEEVGGGAMVMKTDHHAAAPVDRDRIVGVSPPAILSASGARRSTMAHL